MPEPASWELRHAWCALALLGAAHLPFLYVEGVAERLLTWLTSRALFLRTYAVEEAPLASASLLTLAILLAGSTLLLVRCGRFPFGRGSWSAGKTLGSALVALLGFRLFAAAWVSALPDSLFASHAPAASTVSDLAQAMARAYGAPSVWGFLAVGIPIVEELIFRSVLLDSFRRHLPSLWANLAQAALFGVLHEPWGMVPVFIAFGAAAGRLAERSGSLRAGLIMHAGNNALECTALAL